MDITGDSFLGVRALSAKSARASLSTALPQLCHPLSGFRTLSAVYSRPGLVALFHATSAHRISVFRAFSSPSAVVSLDTRCSLVVAPALAFIDRLDDRHVPLLSVPCSSPSLVSSSSEILSRASVKAADIILFSRSAFTGQQVWREASVFQRVVCAILTRPASHLRG
jgi:hypothetical protein